ncbi:hypothetical protein JTS98_13035 [Clostridium botulinum]|nr:hypothetical protein [Clostridium botulinum]MCS4526748.1 hypothetical protein [Clostridium botulinum]
MRRLNRYTNINKLVITIISTVCIMLILSFALSFSENKEQKVKETISKVKLDQKRQEEKIDINKKYKVKSEPQVRVYFVNEKVVKSIPLEEYVKALFQLKCQQSFI